MDEVLAAMVSLHQSYSDIMIMPTIERRFFLNRMRETTEESAEEAARKQAAKKKNLGNGRRSYTR